MKMKQAIAGIVAAVTLMGMVPVSAMAASAGGADTDMDMNTGQKVITDFDQTVYQVAVSSADEKTMMEELPKMLKVRLADGSTEMISASWTAVTDEQTESDMVTESETDAGPETECTTENDADWETESSEDSVGSYDFRFRLVLPEGYILDKSKGSLKLPYVYVQIDRSKSGTESAQEAMADESEDIIDTAETVPDEETEITADSDESETDEEMAAILADFEAYFNEYYSDARAAYDEDIFTGQEWFIESAGDSADEFAETYATNASGTMNYDKWVIKAGANFGNIWEDGRSLAHVGIFQINVKTAANGITTGWKTAYCVHHNANSAGGHTYKDIVAYLTNTQKKNLTGMALYFGLSTFSNGWNQTWGSYPTQADMKKYLATQVLVWIIEKGWYSYPTNGVFTPNAKALSAAKTICNKSSTYNRAGNSYDTFTAILTDMQNYDRMPSFSNRASGSAPKYSMGYDITTKKYTLVLTDTNNIISQCTISGLPSGVSSAISGNKLTLTSSSRISSAVTFKISKKSFTGSDALIVWSDRTNTSYQQLATFRTPGGTAMAAYTALNVNPVVEMSVQKVWQDNENVSGLRPKELKVELWMGLSSHAKTTKVQDLTLNDSNNWYATVSNLTKTDKDGKNIYYSFFEQETENYTASLTESKIADNHWQYTFTNTLSGTVSLPCKKIWEDENDALGIRPNELKVTCYSVNAAGVETPVAGCILNASNEWQYTFENLSRFDSTGKEIKYILKEAEPENYTGTTEIIDGCYVFTNTPDVPESGTLIIEKASRRPDLTEGNPMYSLLGAVYGVYTDEACTDEKEVGELITGADGRSEKLTDLAFATYYVKEKKAPQGFLIDETVYPVQLSEEITKRTVTLNVQEDYQTSEVSLLKQPSLPDMTEGNSGYSLKGAVYTVYSDQACTKRVGRLTTDSSGKSNTISGLTAGTYYVLETAAPAGFELDREMHTVTVRPGEKGVLEVRDKPVCHPADIQIDKYSSDGIVSETLFPLDGTEFTICYYAEKGLDQQTIVGKKPARTWVIRVIGKTDDEENTVYHTQLDAAHLVTEKSDALYTDETGAAVLPFGTMTIAETKSADKYTLSGYVLNAKGNVISENPSEALIFEITDADTLTDVQGIRVTGSLELDVVDVPSQGSIKIIKHDGSNSVLAGVEFTLQTEEGEIIASGLTDEKGELVFEELKEGRYQLTETATVNGQQLLKEPVSVTIPMSLTPAEAEAQKLDKEQAVYDAAHDLYLVYDVTYEIGNSVNLSLPMTGGNGSRDLRLLLVTGLLGLMAGLILSMKKGGGMDAGGSEQQNDRFMCDDREDDGSGVTEGVAGLS